MLKHFKLTNETKIIFLQKTLYQIELTIDCKWGSKGDKGGWVEKEENLSENAWVSGNALVYGDARVYGDALVSENALVYGNARVYGDARVYGNARVYGDARVSENALVSENARVSGDAWVSGDAEKSPIHISSLKYPVTITDDHLRVGCEFYTFDEWENFDDKRIIQMDGMDALKWWKTHKPIVMGIIKENRK